MVDQKRYYRKIIRIRAVDSPNVRLALAQIERGEEPTGEVLVPGVLTWQEYCKRKKMWDEIQKTVSLDAQFYKGGLNRLFPEDALELAQGFSLTAKGTSKGLGIDTAEGGDDSVWTVSSDTRVLEQIALKTPDTSKIFGVTVGLIRDHRLEPSQVMFDAGGGGKQHADYLRKKGYDVRTVGFGQRPTDPNQERKTSLTKLPVKQRVENKDTLYVYKNRRAEMYGLAALAVCAEGGFGIEGKYTDLLWQLSKMPKLYDSEGRLFLPPKDKPTANYTGDTLKKILGRSPDHADSFVMSIFVQKRRKHKARVGGAVS